jgi:hypothetical protein
MSQSAGTGSPVWFRCHGARNSCGGHRVEKGVRLTGRKRKKRPNRGCALGTRSTTSQREYECLDCGFKGWSNHVDLAHMAGEDKYA